MHARLCVQTDKGNRCNGFIPRLIDSSDPPLSRESNDSMLSDCSSFLSSVPPGWMYSMDLAVKLGSSKLCRPSKATRSMCLAPDCVCMRVCRVWHACMHACMHARLCSMHVGTARPLAPAGLCTREFLAWDNLGRIHPRKPPDWEERNGPAPRTSLAEIRRDTPSLLSPPGREHLPSSSVRYHGTRTARCLHPRAASHGLGRDWRRHRALHCAFCFLLAGRGWRRRCAPDRAARSSVAVAAAPRPPGRR